MKVTVYSAIKHETTSRVLPEVFSVVDANPRAIAIAMRVYLANARQDTAKTKTRGEVTMTGKKVYKQKGTGGARHGSKRAPIFVGGGVTFGPHGNKNSALSLPRRQRARSLAQAFSLKSTQVSMMVDLDLAKDKTATFAKAFDRVDHKAKSMIMVIAPSERALARGMRNLSTVSVCYADQVNSYDVIRADQVVMSEEAVTILTSRLTVKKNDEKSEKQGVVTEAVEPLEPELIETVEKPVTTKPVAKPATKKPAVKKSVATKSATTKPAKTTKTKTVKTKKTA